MVHRIVFRVGSDDALEFWEERSPHENVSRSSATTASLRFSDPEGLELEISVVETTTSR